MSIDELKEVWSVYDKKVEASQRINDLVIERMIAHRSGYRFVQAKRNYLVGFLWMFGCASLALLVCLTNPFDYRATWQFVPLWIYIGCMVIFILEMIRTYASLRTINVSVSNVDGALKKIIEVYERPRKLQQYALLVFLFSGVILFPLSFLPRGIERAGFWPALGERLIPMAIAALMIYAAHKLGAFKERYKEKFKGDLNELQELKAMSRELSAAS